MQGVTQNETDLLTAIKEIIDNSQDNFKRLYLDGDPIVELGKKYYEEFSTIKLVGFKQIGKRFSPIFGNDEIPNDENTTTSCQSDSLTSKFEQMVFNFTV